MSDIGDMITIRATPVSDGSAESYADAATNITDATSLPSFSFRFTEKAPEEIYEGQEKLANLRGQLNTAFLERSMVIDGLIASLIARENCILYGPPGTAKSLLIQSLAKAFVDIKYFKRLLRKDTPTDEVLGPLSLEEFKAGKYARNVEHSLPGSDIAFLDEITRANSIILNSLLTLINEGEFSNPEPQASPLKSVFGAANTLPDDPELEAFVDRFMFCPWVEDLNLAKSKRRLMQWALTGNFPQVDEAQIDFDLIFALKERSQTVKVSREVERCLYVVFEKFSVSSRKRIKLVSLLKAYALVKGFSFVSLEAVRDLIPHCIWKGSRDNFMEVNDFCSRQVPKPEAKVREMFEQIQKLPRRVSEQNDLLVNAALEEFETLSDAIATQAANSYIDFSELIEKLPLFENALIAIASESLD